ncbi:MAG: uroporphyrinogen-III synthase [Actinomycetota bacterium]|nr:uroporphyrinogen-III synthase [Actinomycetota bacterium]
MSAKAISTPPPKLPKPASTPKPSPEAKKKSPTPSSTTAGDNPVIRAATAPVKSRKKAPVGTVALVAAGPGDPDLLTLRAVALMREADVIVADPATELIARQYMGIDAEFILAGDHSKAMLDAAREGKNVVRLIAGDPIVDGTLVQEAAALRKAKIPFEVAPGVSEVTGIPAYAGFSLTGGKVRQIRVVDGSSSDLPWVELAQPQVTTVYLNGADSCIEIATHLLNAGADPKTPIAVTRQGTTVDQRTLAGTLGEIGAIAKRSKQAGPGVVVVGEVVAQRDKADWFEAKPLFGWRVLIPRTQDSSDSIVALLRRHGAVPMEVPTISVEPPRTPQQIDRAVHGLVSGRYEWIGFTSVNAVRAIREKLASYGLDARSFAGLKVAAVGEATIAALIEFGVRPDLVPLGDQTTADLLEEWPSYDSLTDPINRVFLPRADIATESLVAGLTELGWEVEDITAFRTVRAAPPPAEIREAIKTGGFDAVLFTSSSTVRNLVGIAGKPHHTTVVACIGPQTAKTAEEHGLRVDVMAEASTLLGLVDALAAHGEELRLAAAEAGEGSWRPSRRRTPARRKA